MVKGTKSLNPADKARKEARRKELKKNKKQRQQVRVAAIEGKNPELILADLEKLDTLEFNVANNTAASDNFYKDRRKKLKESWNKVLIHYLKEDPERHAKLKNLETEYEKNYKRLAKEFEAIKAAQEVKIEDVFLPPEPTDTSHDISDDDPLLSESIFISFQDEDYQPPGCPPGLPPDLKQLVDNLKASVAVPLLTQQQPLPTVPYRNRPRLDRTNTRVVHKNSKKPDVAPQAVIESKPIIFKPKATKFIPSSVRSKVTQ